MRNARMIHLTSNKDVHGTTSLTELLLHDFWGQDITLSDSHKSYRPITTLTFRLNHALHGLDACGFHVGDVTYISLYKSL